MWSDAVRVTDFLKRSHRPLLSLSLFLPHATTCLVLSALLHAVNNPNLLLIYQADIKPIRWLLTSFVRFLTLLRIINDL